MAELNLLYHILFTAHGVVSTTSTETPVVAAVTTGSYEEAEAAGMNMLRAKRWDSFTIEKRYCGGGSPFAVELEIGPTP